MSFVERVLREFFRRCGDAQVRYAVLHGYDELPERLSSDLDLIVHPGDFGRVREILNGLSDLRIVQLRCYETNSYAFVLASSGAYPPVYLQIDVALDYRRNGRILFTADELLLDSRPLKGFRVVAAPVEYGYLLVKKLLKGAVPEDQRQRLTKLHEELDREAETTTNDLLGAQAGGLVNAALRNGDWQALDSNLIALRRKLLWRSAWRSPIRLLRYWRADLWRRWLRLRQSIGCVIAIVGNDAETLDYLAGEMRDKLEPAFFNNSLLLRWYGGLQDGKGQGLAALFPIERIKAQAQLSQSYMIIVEILANDTGRLAPSSADDLRSITDRWPGARLPKPELTLIVERSAGARPDGGDSGALAPRDPVPPVNAKGSAGYVRVDCSGSRELAVETGLAAALEHLHQRFLRYGQVWW